MLVSNHISGGVTKWSDFMSLALLVGIFFTLIARVDRYLVSLPKMWYHTYERFRVNAMQWEAGTTSRF
jgi:hypothetical protein